MSRADVTLEDLYLYECGYFKDKTGNITKMKNGIKKKVLKHLKEDTHEFKEQIKDDKKLANTLKKKVKK